MPSVSTVKYDHDFFFNAQVNMATSKMEDIKKEYEMKLDEYARLLDIRAARIKVGGCFKHTSWLLTHRSNIFKFCSIPFSIVASEV